MAMAMMEKAHSSVCLHEKEKNCINGIQAWNLAFNKTAKI